MGAGTCRNGDLCTWAHSVDEIGMPIPAPEQELAPIVLHQPMVSHMDSLGAAEAEVVKRTICKFWLTGKCTKGESCTWAHGEEEVGEAVVVAEAFVHQAPIAKPGLGS